MMQWYSEDLKVVKDASDLNSSGRLLKVVEIILRIKLTFESERLT